MNGNKIIIETDLTTDKFERKLEKLQAKYKNEEIDLKLKFNEYEKTANELLETRKNLNAIKKEHDEINKNAAAARERYDFLFKKGQSSTITAGEFNELQSLKRPLESLEENQGKINAEYDKMVANSSKLNENLEKAKAEFEKQKNKVAETRKEIEFINVEIAKNKIGDVANKFENTENASKRLKNSIKDIVKHVTRWGLAVFGIRSIYFGIRQAISTISQYDQQLATDLQYIKYALAMTIKPIVEWLIKAVYTLMQYINYIWYRWFGHPLFQNAGVEQFTKNLSGANKEAKELNRTLASFDEMNVLNDNSSGSASAGVGAPSFDLSQIQDVPKPWWVEWIANNKELILTIAGIIGSLFAANKLGEILGGIGAIMGAPNGTGLLGMLGTLGQIALIAGGIVITGYIASKFLKDIKKLKKEIASVNEAARQGVPEYIKQTDDLEQLERDLNVQRTAGYKILFKTSLMISKNSWLTKSYNDTLKTNVGNADKFLQKEMEIYNTGKLQTDEKQKLLDELAQEKQYIDAVINQLKVQGQDTSELKRIQENYNQAIAKMVLDLGTKTPQAYDILRQKMEGYLNSGMSKTQAVMATMRDLNNMKLNNKSMTIDINADTSQAERNTNNWIYNIKRLINNVLPGVGAAGLAITRMLTQGFAKGGIIYPNVPRLASGGIINMPGKGVPLASAYGGERGAEGVIPLTDSQQMALMGEAIGRNVVINANIINQMNGRTISRELHKVSADSDFLYNR